MLKNDRSTGSDFILGRDYVLTNRHIVSDPDPHFLITSTSGIKTDGEVIYFDRKLDFTIVKAPGLSYVSIYRFISVTTCE